MPKTLIEPFRIKSIEPIRMTTRAGARSLYRLEAVVQGITRQPPFLRHFTSEFAWVDA